MGNIVEKFAFPPMTSSYNQNISYLSFVPRSSNGYCVKEIQSVPVRHLHVDDNWLTMLMCHGNAEDIGMYDIEELSEQFGCNICIFDYAGYGLHTKGIPSEYDCQKDVVAVYKYLINDRKINPKKIVLYGRSLGTGPICYLANYIYDRNYLVKPKKLILVSPLYSAASTLTYLWVPGDIFKNYCLAYNIGCSTLIIHGSKDNVVPYDCGKELAKLFPNLYKFYTLKNCGHNNIFTLNYYNEINNFLQS